jgi:hypothetical protein
MHPPQMHPPQQPSLLSTRCRFVAIACAWSGGWISPGGGGSALLYGGGAMEPPAGGDPEVKLTPFAVDRTSCLRLKKLPCPCPCPCPCAAMAERGARGALCEIGHIRLGDARIRPIHCWAGFGFRGPFVWAFRSFGPFQLDPSSSPTRSPLQIPGYRAPPPVDSNHRNLDLSGLGAAPAKKVSGLPPPLTQLRRRPAGNPTSFSPSISALGPHGAR